MKLPIGETNPIPAIYVNGKLVPSAGIQLVSGSTVADAAFVRQHIDASYAGQGLSDCGSLQRDRVRRWNTCRL